MQVSTAVAMLAALNSQTEVIEAKRENAMIVEGAVAARRRRCMKPLVVGDKDDIAQGLEDTGTAEILKAVQLIDQRCAEVMQIELEANDMEEVLKAVRLIDQRCAQEAEAMAQAVKVAQNADDEERRAAAAAAHKAAESPWQVKRHSHRQVKGSLPPFHPFNDAVLKSPARRAASQPIVEHYEAEKAAPIAMLPSGSTNAPLQSASKSQKPLRTPLPDRPAEHV